jgi:hypothetical protein
MAHSMLSGTELSDDCPVGDIKNAQYEAFLPTKDDLQILSLEFVELISRVIVEYVPSLRQYKSLISSHIDHEHSSNMSKKSEMVIKLRYYYHYYYTIITLSMLYGLFLSR